MSRRKVHYGVKSRNPPALLGGNGQLQHVTHRKLHLRELLSGQFYHSAGEIQPQHFQTLLAQVTSDVARPAGQFQNGTLKALGKKIEQLAIERSALQNVGVLLGVFLGLGVVVAQRGSTTNWPLSTRQR